MSKSILLLATLLMTGCSLLLPSAQQGGGGSRQWSCTKTIYPDGRIEYQYTIDSESLNVYDKGLGLKVSMTDGDCSLNVTAPEISQGDTTTTQLQLLQARQVIDQLLKDSPL